MKNSKKKWWVLLFSIPLIGVFLHAQNNALTTSEYIVASQELPHAFNGYRILQLSDLHNHSFGKDQAPLIKQAKETNPDIIVLTGDLVDARRYNEEPSLNAVKQLLTIAPVYYVTGNHEWRSGHFDALEQALIKAGVTVLRNNTVKLTNQEESILLHGIDDPFIDTTRPPNEVLETSLEELVVENAYQILLAHRPEHFNLYAQYNVDVVFSGHAHGGQMRLPLVGGLFAPTQGLFPELTEGVHTQQNTAIVVSRGLGNSLFPFRLFNQPELVVVTLKKE